ncbi:cation diffusion facilitator family transporter [Thermosulfuriphilus sp.]
MEATFKKYQRIDRGRKASLIMARLALISALINLLLAFSKYFFGKLTGSLALKADALHSAADVVCSLTIWAGIKISTRRSRNFPYGLYKVENLAALAAAFFIFYAAYEIIKESLRLQTPTQLEYLPWAILGVLLMAVVTFFFSKYEYRLAKLTGSPSLEADAKHTFTELLSAAVILVGLLGSLTPFKFTDKLAALFVAMVIIHLGWGILRDSIKVLLEASVDSKTLSGIISLIRAHPEIVSIKSLLGRQAGRFKLIEAEIILDCESLEEAHALVTAIEEEIYQRFPDIDRVFIHFEPRPREEVIVAIPVDEEGAKVMEHFGCAPAFLLVYLDCKDGQKIKEKRLISNPQIDSSRKKGVKTAEFLAGLGVNRLLLKKCPESSGAFYALKALKIEVICRPSFELATLERTPLC